MITRLEYESELKSPYALRRATIVRLHATEWQVTLVGQDGVVRVDTVDSLTAAQSRARRWIQGE